MTNMVNYNWKQIVFGIRDIIKQHGYKEEYPISDVIEGNDFSCYKFITERLEPHFIIFKDVNHVNRCVEAIPKKINKSEENYRFGIIVFCNEEIGEDISEIIIDAGIKNNRDKTIVVDELERLQKLYIENYISIRFVISLIHEIGHTFNDYMNNEEEMEKIEKNRLSDRELNYYYHKQPGESYSDFIAIDTLFKHGEEILELILSNRTEEDINRYA